MKELLNCRAMESVCRQRATLYPEESWKWLAEAEMWNHKAIEEPVVNLENAALPLARANATAMYSRSGSGSVELSSKVTRGIREHARDVAGHRRRAVAASAQKARDAATETCPEGRPT
jgi:hypothetical protein